MLVTNQMWGVRKRKGQGSPPHPPPPRRPVKEQGRKSWLGLRESRKMSLFGLVKFEVFEGRPNEGVQKDVGLTCTQQEASAGIWDGTTEVKSR